MSNGHTMLGFGNVCMYVCMFVTLYVCVCIGIGTHIIYFVQDGGRGELLVPHPPINMRFYAGVCVCVCVCVCVHVHVLVHTCTKNLFTKTDKSIIFVNLRYLRLKLQEHKIKRKYVIFVIITSKIFLVM